MQAVYIVAAKRTPIGRFQGALRPLSAPALGARVIAALQKEQRHMDVDLPVEQVIMGQVLTAGSGQAPARQSAIFANLNQNVPCLTVNKVCGSGLQAVILAAQSIALADAHCIIAGGQESMSSAPYLLPSARDGWRLGHQQALDSVVFDGLWDPYVQKHMGSCAERCAREFSLSRQSQDDYAKLSYERARESSAKGFFKDEIVPISVVQGKNEQIIVEDEEPSKGDLERIGSLKPAFEQNGSITAANASKLNDGAAALAIASEKLVREFKLTPIARVVGWAGYASEPEMFTTAPIASIEKVLNKCGLRKEDIDHFEINEAFAVVPLVAMQQLSLPPEKVNPFGGAIALGHPIGASGARILTTLIYGLKRKSSRYGLASICIGGGEALSIVIENI